MYRIRFHGRGGQGVKTGARILGSAFFAAGFEVQDAPRYGAERRGAPIDASVRAARRPIEERGALRSPDLVVVADETLFAVPAAGVLAGIAPETWLVIHSAVPAGEWCARLARGGRVRVVSPPGAAEQQLLGVIGAALAARLVGVIAWPAFETALREELAAHGAVDEALAHARARWDALAPSAGAVTEGPARLDAARAPGWIELPCDPPHLAAPDVHVPLTSLEVRTGLWRTQRPVLDTSLCHGCAWICSTLCPDGAIAAPGGPPRVDYDHCKGCGVCVAVCPHHALHLEPERSPEARP